MSRAAAWAIAGLIGLTPLAPATAQAIRWERLPDIPDPVGFAGPYAGVSHGALMFAGGANFGGRDNFAGAPKIWFDEIYVLDSPAGQWRVSDMRLPVPLAYGVSVTWHDQMIVAGGENAQGMHDDVFALSWDGATVGVERLPRLPHAVGYTDGALVGDTLYVVGGLASGTSSVRGFWSLDLAQPSDKRAWKVEEPWPGPSLALTTVGAMGGDLYVFGGGTIQTNWLGKPDRVFQAASYRFTPGQGWTRCADMPFVDAAAPSPAPVSGGRLLVMGGDNGGLFYRTAEVGARHPGSQSQIFAYDPATDTWSAGGNLPVHPGPDLRAQPSAATMPPVTVPTTMWNGRLVIPSGEIRPGTRTPHVLAATLPE